MMRPREKDYEVLTIPPEYIILAKTNKTLRETYPCDRIYAFGYGYNHEMASMKNGITDIFSVEEKIATLPEFDEETSGQPNTRKLCELDSEMVGEQCTDMLKKSRGHLLVQSYIDVIIAGILEAGFVSKVGEFEVHGGAFIEHIKERFGHHVDYARSFAATTTWPVTEVIEKRVLYVNDRNCPRNPNPVYTPHEHLHPRHRSGVSSTAPASDTTAMRDLIDEIIRTSSEDGETLLKHRINDESLCEKLDVLPRWLDGVLTDETTLWDLAYRNTAPAEPEQNCDM
jgi:hypothetical protein